jgi:hypothetical protein
MIYSEKKQKKKEGRSGIKHASEQSSGAKDTRFCPCIFQFQFFWLS